MMRVTFTPASLRDLTSVGDFIASDNRKRAKSFVGELRSACQSLGADSLRYPLQQEVPGMRRMPVGNYLVLYRVFEERVQIVRVIHSARDIAGLTLDN